LRRRVYLNVRIRSKIKRSPISVISYSSGAGAGQSIEGKNNLNFAGTARYSHAK
jgi:hypothetical protein